MSLRALTRAVYATLVEELRRQGHSLDEAIKALEAMLEPAPTVLAPTVAPDVARMRRNESVMSKLMQAAGQRPPVSKKAKA